MLRYSDTKEIPAAQLKELFSSVRWESAKYPERLERAMKGFSAVFSAWDGERLVGLLAAMDDGEMTAYIHYLLVSPDFQGQGVGKKTHRGSARTLPRLCARRAARRRESGVLLSPARL